jgi:hypothetical protein
MFVNNLSKDEIEAIKNSTKGTLRVEGLEPSRQAENINDLFLNGYIDSKTAIEEIKKYWGVK